MIKKYLHQTIPGILLLSLWIVSGSAHAQGELGPDEKDQLVKEIKAYKKNLEAFGQLKQDDVDLSQQIGTKQRELEIKKQKQDSLNTTLKKKDDSIESLTEQIRLLTQGTDNYVSTEGRAVRECAFSVQIGAYLSRDLTQYKDQPNLQKFIVETDKEGDGFNKYALGYFTRYWEAWQFSDYLNSTGAQTFVIGFKNGERVADLREVPECTEF